MEKDQHAKRRKRVALRTEDLPAEDIARIAASEPPVEAEAHDHELLDTR